MPTRLTPSTRMRSLIARLIDDPELARTVRALPHSEFTSLIAKIGVEDAGEIIAFASTDQLVAAFDEELFVNDRPGEREAFSTDRFVTWLEVLLEAGDAAVARRITELSDDFVVHAVNSLLLVLDLDALNMRMGEGDQAAFYADKALESALAEEIDGYLLVARRHDGWDAALSLILALDQNHRHYLERILDHCVRISRDYVDDLDLLTELLTAGESLAEDVEAEREERRAGLGYVAARDAAAFLTLARSPFTEEIDQAPRDAVTRAYFRYLSRPDGIPSALPRSVSSGGHNGSSETLRSFAVLPLQPSDADSVAREDPLTPFIEAMRQLQQTEPTVFQQRMEEVAYLANVIASGASRDHRRFRPSEAAETAILTAALGAEMEAVRRGRRSRKGRGAPSSPEEIGQVLATIAADLLFRRASGHLASTGTQTAVPGLVISREELSRVRETALRRAEP